MGGWVGGGGGGRGEEGGGGVSGGVIFNFGKHSFCVLHGLGWIGYSLASALIQAPSFSSSAFTLYRYVCIILPTNGAHERER